MFQLLGRETYSRGNSRRSVTQLIDSPRLVALKEANGDGIVEDLSERLWAFFGSAVHKMIEEGMVHSDWHAAEERLFAEVGGWTISGAVDLQEFSDGTAALYDWKVCSIWSVRKPKIEWANQLNLLAWFVEKRGLRVVKLQIGAMVRDHNRLEARRDPTYPPAPLVMVDIPLWSMAEREAYVTERVRLHQIADMALTLGEEPDPCTPEEMWAKDPAWAVYKKGNKRATKVCDNEAEALDLVTRLGNAIVEYRPGERTRCRDFCSVSKFCIYAPLEGDEF